MSTRRSKSLAAMALMAALTAVALMPEPVAAAKKVTLRWWVPANYTWITLRDRFQKAHPNIKVDIIDGDMDNSTP